MDRWSGRVALVTGASVGIGAAVVGALVKHGMKVVGCGRNLENLQKLSSELSGPGSFHPIQCDLTKEADIAQMFSTIQSEQGGVDVCVNNAGLALVAPLLSAATSNMRQMMEVNVLGLCICTRESVKSMQHRKVDGHVINIASTAAHAMLPIDDFHFYSATKHAVKAITEGVRMELHNLKSDIRVSQISPGVVSTEFFKRMIGEEGSQQILSDLGYLEPSDVADAVVYALAAPPYLQMHDMILRSRQNPM